jgi:glycosyltransferase involved in cell wall biosynthesis
MNQYFNVLAVSSNGEELKEVENLQGIKTKAIELSRQITPFKDLVSLYNMVILFQKEKPHIVHTHTPKAGLIGMLAAYITRVPHRLHTVAGLPLMESRGIKRKVLLFVEWLTYKCATHVYPNSLGLNEFILTNHLSDSSKVKVLGNGSSNGIDTKHFMRTDEVLKAGEGIRKTYNLSQDDFLFIFVGRIVKDKGINELLHAFNKLSNETTNVKLLLVGPFEEVLDPIANKSKEILKNNQNIIEVGFQNDVRPFFAISDCLVFPSYREGFPNVVMQAGAMGLPSIVSDINGCNEIIENDINGLLIIPKDEENLFYAMIRLHKDNELRKKLTEKTRKLIIDRYNQEYVWNIIKNEYNIILNNVKKKV